MAAITTEQLKAALKHHFGYDDFRLNQRAVVEQILAGRDIMAIMPTGGGKSICYQLPALLLPGTAIVVSPLIALMKDQVDALNANGINASFLNSTQSPAEQRVIIQSALAGTLKMLYIAPERIPASPEGFFDFLTQIKPSLFAIDEAHCISSWGHDFRPEYLKLAILKQRFPTVPVAAFTASADGRTQKDILDKLAIPAAQVFISSFNRQNIWYYVLPKANTINSIATYINAHAGECGIIYALSRASTEKIAAELKARGISAAHYHAGMQSADRALVQEAFQKDAIRVIVATIAFGMGIDKSNVRYVIHHDVPKNIEGYYQETGRAGRDGLKSEAILYYSRGDIMKLRQFAIVEGNPEQTRIATEKLREMERFCEHEGCRRQLLLRYFGENAPDYCGSCDYCLSSLEQKEVTVDAQKLLSAIARTGQRFGASYIIDFLRGSAAEKIEDAHKELKTWGIGKHLKKEEWAWLINNLVNSGSLDRTDDVYAALKLNNNSWKILKGDTQVNLVMRKAQKTPVAVVEELQHDAALLNELRDVRADIAEQENVPAYAVVADNSLLELATYLPANPVDLKLINGFGDFKVGKYGGKFLDVIRKHMTEHNLTSKVNLKSPKSEKKQYTNRPIAGSTQETSFQMFQEGMTIADIAEARNMVESTIATHLTRFVALGELDVKKVVPEPKLSSLIELINSFPQFPGVKTIKDTAGDDVSFAEIRLVMEHLNALAAKPDE